MHATPRATRHRNASRPTHCRQTAVVGKQRVLKQITDARRDGAFIDILHSGDMNCLCEFQCPNRGVDDNPQPQIVPSAVATKLLHTLTSQRKAMASPDRCPTRGYPHLPIATGHIGGHKRPFHVPFLPFPPSPPPQPTLHCGIGRHRRYQRPRKLIIV